MRRDAKIDDNQKSIVRTLRKAGASVLSLAAVGDGCPDLLVHRAGTLYLLEVKDGSKSPSRRALTPLQIDFAKVFPVNVVRNEEEALKAVGL